MFTVMIDPIYTSLHSGQNKIPALPFHQKKKTCLVGAVGLLWVAHFETLTFVRNRSPKRGQPCKRGRRCKVSENFSVRFARNVKSIQHLANKSGSERVIHYMSLHCKWRFCPGNHSRFKNDQNSFPNKLAVHPMLKMHSRALKKDIAVSF